MIQIIEAPTPAELKTVLEVDWEQLGQASPIIQRFWNGQWIPAEGILLDPEHWICQATNKKLLWLRIVCMPSPEKNKQHV